MNYLVTVCISFIFGSTKDYFSLATSLGEFPGQSRDFGVSVAGQIAIEVKIRDCPRAFGTDGGSAESAQPERNEHASETSSPLTNTCRAHSSPTLYS